MKIRNKKIKKLKVKSTKKLTKNTSKFKNITYF